MWPFGRWYAKGQSRHVQEIAECVQFGLRHTTTTDSLSDCLPRWLQPGNRRYWSSEPTATSLFHVTLTYICMAQSKSMYCAHVLNGTSLVWLKHSTVVREHHFIDFFSSSSKQHHHCYLIRVLTSNELSADLQWPTLSVSLLSHHVFPAASNPLPLLALWFMIILSSFFWELLICNLAIGNTGFDGAVGTQGDCPTRTVNHGPGSIFSMLIYSSLRLLSSWRLFKGTVRLVSWPVSLCVLVLLI